MHQHEGHDHQHNRDIESELRAKYSDLIDNVLDLRQQLEKGPLIFEGGKGAMNRGNRIFLSAFAAAFACLIVIILGAVPVVGAFFRILPGWLVFVVGALGWYKLMQLAQSHQKLKLEQSGLSCWIGGEWKFTPWEKIEKLQVTEQHSRQSGRSFDVMTVITDSGTFNYNTTWVDNFADAMSLIKWKLGDRASSRSQ